MRFEIESCYLRTIQQWFKKLLSGNMDLQNDPRGKLYNVVNTDQLRMLIENNLQRWKTGQTDTKRIKEKSWNAVSRDFQIETKLIIFCTDW